MFEAPWCQELPEDLGFFLGEVGGVFYDPAQGTGPTEGAEVPTGLLAALDAVGGYTCWRDAIWTLLSVGDRNVLWESWVGMRKQMKKEQGTLLTSASEVDSEGQAVGGKRGRLRLGGDLAPGPGAAPSLALVPAAPLRGPGPAQGALFPLSLLWSLKAGVLGLVLVQPHTSCVPIGRYQPLNPSFLSHYRGGSGNSDYLTRIPV